MSNTKSYDWDNATVRIRVPIHWTATSDIEEFDVRLSAFARLLLTSVPAEWFAQPPISGDLPLAITYDDPPIK